MSQDLFRIVDTGFQWALHEGPGTRPPTDEDAWVKLTCHEISKPCDAEDAAEQATEKMLDGEYPECMFTFIWIRRTSEPSQVYEFKVELDHEITYSAAQLSGPDDDFEAETPALATAKIDGTCFVCGTGYRAGDQIRHWEEGQAHVVCPEPR